MTCIASKFVEKIRTGIHLLSRIVRCRRRSKIENGRPKISSKEKRTTNLTKLLFSNETCIHQCSFHNREERQDTADAHNIYHISIPVLSTAASDH
jgi:hypothetical protein